MQILIIFPRSGRAQFKKIKSLSAGRLQHRPCLQRIMLQSSTAVPKSRFHTESEIQASQIIHFFWPSGQKKPKTSENCHGHQILAGSLQNAGDKSNISIERTPLNLWEGKMTLHKNLWKLLRHQSLDLKDGALNSTLLVSPGCRLLKMDHMSVSFFFLKSKQETSHPSLSLPPSRPFLSLFDAGCRSRLQSVTRSKEAFTSGLSFAEVFSLKIYDAFHE